MAVQRRLEAEGQSSATDDVMQQQQQPVAMATGEDDSDDDDDAPPDYNDIADCVYHRRVSVIGAEMSRECTSGSTLASDAAAEDTSLFSWPFVGSLPAPPPYQPYTMTTGQCTLPTVCDVMLCQPFNKRIMYVCILYT